MQNHDVSYVCQSCGVSANVLTCLNLFAHPPVKLQHDISTWVDEKCDVCKKVRPVTQPRDFFYPDFSLLAKAMARKNKTLKKTL